MHSDPIKQPEILHYFKFKEAAATKTWMLFIKIWHNRKMTDTTGAKWELFSHFDAQIKKTCKAYYLLQAVAWPLTTII